MLVAPSASALARKPVPFKDAYHDGYNVVLWGDGYSNERIGAVLDRVRLAGTKRITIPIVACQTSATSSDVGWCSESFKNYSFNMARFVSSRGFSLSLLPIVFAGDGKWRGYFDPKEPDLWFAGYTSWIKDVARFAEEQKHTELIVASELVTLNKYDEHWKKVLRETRKEFSGPLIIAVNHGDHVQDFWEEADAIGVSAYFRLAQPEVASPSQKELNLAWTRIRDELLKYSRLVKRPLHFSEVGYRSVDIAAHSPWDYENGKTVDSDLQRRCFAAFSNAWAGRRELVRFSVWAAAEGNDPHYPTSYDPIGKPAEKVIKELLLKRKALVSANAAAPDKPKQQDRKPAH